MSTPGRNPLIELLGDDVAETKQILDYWQQEVDRVPKLELAAKFERRRFDLRRL